MSRVIVVERRPEREDGRRGPSSSSLRGEIDIGARDSSAGCAADWCQPSCRTSPPSYSARVVLRLRAGERARASYASLRTRHARARLPGLPLRVSFTADVHPGAVRYGLRTQIRVPTYIYIYMYIHTSYIHTYIYTTIYIYTYILVPLGGGSVLLDPPRRARSL